MACVWKMFWATMNSEVLNTRLQIPRNTVANSVFRSGLRLVVSMLLKSLSHRKDAVPFLYYVHGCEQQPISIRSTPCKCPLENAPWNMFERIYRTAVKVLGAANV